MKPMLEPHARSYWRTALRELTIVIIGVLIALAVSDWSTRRSEGRLEAQYLQRLLEDLRRDSLLAANNLGPSVTRKRQALATIAPFVRRQTGEIRDTLAFLKTLGMGGSMGVANASWATRITFNELNSTGTLRLIENADLRSRIVNYYADTQILENRLDARRSHYALAVHQLIPAELRDSLDLATARSFKLNRVFSRIATDDFENELNQEINYAIFVRLMVEGFTAQTNELLQHVHKELAAHK